MLIFSLLLSTFSHLFFTTSLQLESCYQPPHHKGDPEGSSEAKPPVKFHTVRKGWGQNENQV
jgi:hypothetical protein